MHEHRLTKCSDIEQFIFAGNATFTIVGREKRYTYKIKRAEETIGFISPTPWFVSVLVGPDNTSNFSYIGIITESEKTSIRVTKNSRSHPVPLAGLEWILRKILVFSPNDCLPEHIEFWHQGRCGRCGRPLTVPESIERGIGPECAQHIGGF